MICINTSQIYACWNQRRIGNFRARLTFALRDSRRHFVLFRSSPQGIALVLFIRKLVLNMMLFPVFITREMWGDGRAVHWRCQRWTCLTRAGRTGFITWVSTSCATHTIAFSVSHSLRLFLALQLLIHAVFAFLFDGRDCGWSDFALFFLLWAAWVSVAKRATVFLLGAVAWISLIRGQQFNEEVFGLPVFKQRLLFVL